MGAQDHTERVLRSLYVLISKSEIYEFDEDKIVIDRDRITNLLSELKECIYDMMDAYEMTKESRDQAEREFRKQADEIVLDASHKAEDIYAASVMYTDEALGNVQRIMAEAEESVKTVYEEMQKRLVEERHTVQSNQTDLQSQLQDLTDTDKYFKLITERNREIRKEKEKEQRLAMRQRETAIYADRQTEVRVDQEALRKLGLASDQEETDTADGAAAATGEQPAASSDSVNYADRQTEVRVDQEVLRKLGLAQQESASAQKTNQENASQARTQQVGRENASQARTQQAGRENASQARTQQADRRDASAAGSRQDSEWDPDEEALRRQMLERAREPERKKARLSQRQRMVREEPGELSLMDLNPFAEEAPSQEIEDELIRLDLDEDYFKWKEEQDAQFDANVAKAKRRTRKK